jgi:hypothetical protein
MESDALFAIALSIAMRHLFAVPLHVLAIGLMKYIYVLVWRYDGDPPVYPPAYKWYAKTVAAIIVSSLVAGLLPILPALVRTIGFACVLALQASSFGWDLLLHRRQANASG